MVEITTQKMRISNIALRCTCGSTLDVDVSIEITDEDDLTVGWVFDRMDQETIDNLTVCNVCKRDIKNRMTMICEPEE